MHVAGFFDNGIGFRGTTRAIINYCSACMSLDRQIIPKFYFVKGLRQNNHSIAAQMLNNGIDVIPISSKEQLMQEKLDFLYHVSSSSGESNQWLKSLPYKTLLHQVGYQPPDFTMASHFAYTSYWQSYFLSNAKADVLPYIVNGETKKYEKSIARSELSIPNDAIVLGRHGGIDTWNLSFVSESIKEAIKINKNLYFLFVNTQQFIEHPRVRFLPSTSDNIIIEKYLSACDAMIHARWEGETFGLACAEFLIRKKPIITWSESREKNHILMSDSSCITYNVQQDCTLLLSGITREYIEHKSKLIPITHLKECYSSYGVGNKLIEIIRS